MLSHLFSDQNMRACIAVGLCLWSNNIWGIGLLCMPTRMAVEPTCQLAKDRGVGFMQDKQNPLFPVFLGLLYLREYAHRVPQLKCTDVVAHTGLYSRYIHYAS